MKHPDPQFESQTKVKLMNAEVKALVEAVVVAAFSDFLERDSRAGRRIVEKCLTSSRAREAARKARDMVIRKSALESLTLPGKLADCSEREAQPDGAVHRGGRQRRRIVPSRGATATFRPSCRCAERS